jgi:chromosome partitioning protein
MTRAQRSLNRPTDVFLLRETLEQGHDYELVLIDTAAAVSVYTMNALVASTEVLVPVTPEYQPVVGAEQTIATCGLVRDRLNPGLGDPRMVLTQVDARKRTHAGFGRYVRETYPAGLLSTVIRTSAVLAEARRDGRTVFDTDLSSRGARDYACLADELSAAYFPPTPEAGGDGASLGEIVPAAEAPQVS